MKRTLTVLTLVLSFSLVTPYYSYAEQGVPSDHARDVCAEWMPMPPPPMRHNPMGIREEFPRAGHRVWKEIQSLALDNNQKNAIKEIKRKSAKELIQMRADEDIAAIELRELLDQHKVDMEAVKTKLKQIAELKAEIQLSMIKAVEEVKSKLTTEQKKELRERLETEPDFRPPFPGAVPKHMRMRPIGEK